MHIPDGFLSTPVWAALDAVSLPAVSYAARVAQRKQEDSRASLLGVMGAFVFAAQMINFPVGVGTSGHLLGGTLLSVMLGPAPAVIVMTAVLVIQALLFQDGGVLALGANICNVALAGVLSGYFSYRLWRGYDRRLALFVGGFVSVLLSAGCAMLELQLSGIALTRPILAGSYALFAIGAILEGAITVAVVGAIEKINPDWIRESHHGIGRLRAAVLGMSTLLAGTACLIASSSPDLLERTAENLGLHPQATALIPSPLADYQIAGWAWDVWAKAAAGLLGVAAVYFACVLVGKWMTQRRTT